MLRSRLSRTLLVSHSLLFVTTPTVSHQNLKTVGNFAEEFIPVTEVPEEQKVVLNKHAKVFVKNYIRKNRSSLYKVKQRSREHFPMMDSILTRYKLPVELKYLAVVESELKSKIMSPKGAVGPWQFMPKTARILGLKVNRKYDERTNYTKSTKAAAIYLRDLHREFGDWLLVLAAYNGGPVPVRNAIRKSGSRNFWVLQKYLPAESRGHVKKFIATHYYFEGKGSVTTLTKSEAIEYKKALALLKTAKF
jgi:membrane-bound lytic murein transglycosylase D